MIFKDCFHVTELIGFQEKGSAYFGFEPSGRLHVGILQVVSGLAFAQKMGYEPIMLVADYSAQLNDKTIHDWSSIKQFLPPETTIIIQSELMKEHHDKYFEYFKLFSQKANVSRYLRGIDCAGRAEENPKFSKLYYTLLQCVDMAVLQDNYNLACCIGGTDQRKVHMLFRDIASKLKRTKPLCIHTPLLLDENMEKIGKSTSDKPIYVDELDGVNDKRLQFCKLSW